MTTFHARAVHAYSSARSEIDQNVMFSLGTSYLKCYKDKIKQAGTTARDHTNQQTNINYKPENLQKEQPTNTRPICKKGFAEAPKKENS